MTTITFSNKNMNVRVNGFGKFLAFKSGFVVPAKNIVKAGKNTKPLMPYGVAAFGLGTIFASKIQAGTFSENGEKSFWDVRDPKKAILIKLKNHKYSYIVVEVADRAKTIKEINAKAR